MKIAVLNKRYGHRLAAGLVILGMVLQTLWPVVEAGNAAADALSSEAGSTHEHPAAAGGNGAPAHDDGHGKSSHCGFCSSAAVNAVLVPHDFTGVWRALDAGTVEPEMPDSSQQVPPSRPRIYPRAPPAFS